MAKYKLLSVAPTVRNDLTRDAAEQINVWAAAAGYSGGFTEADVEASRRELEREISECDEYIRERLTITEEVLDELDD